MRLLALTLLCGVALVFTGCFEVKRGSYAKLPEDVLMTEYSTLLTQGRVVHVADADSITILGNDNQRYKIRLQGIDAPEKRQSAGLACKDKFSAMVLDKRVDVEAYKKDRYQRVIAKVVLDDKDMALELIRQGCGWHYKAYADEQSWSDQRHYASAEKQARKAKLGLWAAARPQAPWDYRKR